MKSTANSLEYEAKASTAMCVLNQSTDKYVCGEYDDNSWATRLGITPVVALCVFAMP